MIDELPATVYVATGNTHKTTAVHVNRACEQLANPQTHEIRPFPPETLVTDDDFGLSTHLMWCGTCAYGYQYGTGVPAREILLDSDPADIPP